MKVPILLPNIFNHPFTYESDINLKVGDYVVVPFGKSKITGLFGMNLKKKIIEILNKECFKKIRCNSFKKNNYKIS